MMVVLEGELQARFEGANENVFTTHAGAVSGILPYSRMKVFPANGRAVKPSRILIFPAAKFDELLSHLPELGRRLVATMVDRTREATRGEQQRDRLAALGKLSAGLAHELNNPAAAARRAAERLRSSVAEFRSSASKLEALQLTPARDGRHRDVRIHLLRGRARDRRAEGERASGRDRGDSASAWNPGRLAVCIGAGGIGRSTRRR